MDTLDFTNVANLKRIFRARDKIIFPGAIVHITQRSAGKEPLFLEESDYLYMLHLLKEISRVFSLEIFSFVLMPNHLHLLLKLQAANLSEAGQSLFERYAKFFNKKYERKGHVFGGNYREALCLDETYLLASSLYIHLNPVSAKIVENPLDYRWSSCRLYVKPIKGSSFVKYEFILEILDKEINQARQIYRDFLDEGKKLKLTSVFEDKKALQKFRTKIISETDNPFRAKYEEVLADGILDKKIDELKIKKRLRKPEDFKAQKFLIEQLKARGYNISEIASRLNISRVTVYRYLE
jgi:putative transposase